MSNIRTTKPQASLIENTGTYRGPTGISLAPGEQKNRGVVGENNGNSKDQIPECWSSSLYFSYRNNKPVIYEYANETSWFGSQGGSKKLVKQGALRYQSPKKKGWYEEGDLIFWDQFPMKTLEQIFPELATKGDEEESPITQLVIGFLLGAPKEYRVASRIKKISIEAEHKGRVILCPVLFLDEKTIIELNPRDKNFTSFSVRWAYDKHTASNAFLRSSLNVIGEAALLVAGGGVSGVARTGARGVVKYALKEAIKHSGKKVIIRKVWLSIRSNLGQTIVKATRDYLLAFAKELRAGNEIQELGEKAKSGNLKNEVLQVANLVAWKAFVNTLITESLTPGLNKIVRNSGLSAIQQEVSKRLSTPFTIGIPTMFVTAIADAATKSRNNPNDFNKHFTDALQKDLITKLKAIVSIDLKKIGGSFSL